MLKTSPYLGILIMLACIGSAQAQGDAISEVSALQTQWAVVNYQMSGKEQVAEFEALASQADKTTSAYPDSAEAWIWSGIIKSTYAGAKGGLGALSLAKASRRDLEQALEIDPTAMDGSAYTSLGTLYFSVPGWPVGFGDSDKAEELLTKALEIAPHDIDANYFYAEFMRDQKKYQVAKDYYLIAQSSSSRPCRDVADSYRQKDIALALAFVQEEL